MRTPPLRLAAVALLALSAPAHAGYTFDFQDHRGALGNTQVFSSKVSTGVYDSTYQITAKGLDGTATSDLYVKSSPGDESGLGISSDRDHEIAGTHSVDISVAALKAKFSLASLSFLLGSVQSGEGYVVTAGSLAGPVVGSGGADGTVVVTGANLAYDDFFVRSSGGNVLLGSVTATGAVPEPASLAMTVLGVVASLVGYRRKHRKAATA